MSVSSRLRSFVTGSLVAPVLAGLLLAAAPSPGHAQGAATGQFMNEAVVRVTNTASQPRFKNYGYNDGISILGGWVDTNASLSFTTPLTGGVSYLLLAGGDNDARSIDLEIFDAAGTRLAADGGGFAQAIVRFTPRVTGNYTLRMSLLQARANVPCVCVTTILKKDGWSVPVTNLDKATVKVMRALAAGDQAAQQQRLRVDLRRANNQWAFFGGVLRQGESLAVNKMGLGFGGRLFVGAGDAFADVINLDLEGATGQALKQDVKNNAVSVLDYGATGGLYGLRVHNIRARAPAVVLMAILDIR